MKVKVMHVFAVLALLGLLVTVAHAGRGQGGGEAQVFDCHIIDGKNANRIVTLTDEFGAQNNVRLGFGKLVCTVATMAKGATTDPDFDATPEGQSLDHLKCYEVASPRDLPNPALDVRLFDPIAGGQNLETDGELVNVAKTRFVCTFAVEIVPEP
jgi:hypothetical protein